MNADDLMALNEEIAAMARAGLPLDQGLAAMAREIGRGKLYRVTTAIANDLKAGRTLPEALEQQRGQVPPFYAALISAGVRTGRIGDVLATMTVYARSVANLRTILVDAIFYPVVVLGIALVLFGLLCFCILPQFDQIFREFNMRMPALTEAVLLLGRHPLQLFVLPVAGIIVALVTIRQVMRSSEGGRRIWAHWVYSLPVFGTLLRAMRLAAFTDLLAILVDYELPLPEAFRLAGDACSDPLMAATAQEVHADLSQGHPLGQVLQGRGLVPEWVAWMAGLGERRGTLGQALHQIAELYRHQVEMRAALLRSVLSPFLIIWTAGGIAVVFVFAMIMPMIMPMIKLLEALSK